MTYFLRKSMMSLLLIAAASSCGVREIHLTSWSAGYIYHPAQPPENHPPLCATHWGFY